MYENYIVWQDYRNGGSDIYLTDMKSKVQTRVTKSGKAEYPSVDYGKIVYQDNRNGNYDVYMYDIKTKKETRITSTKSNEYYPSVYGNRIVWDNYGMYVYDIKTKKATKLNLKGNTPSIFRDKIAYVDDSDHVIVYDLVTKKSITISYGVPNRPLISGTKVVWSDYYNSIPVTGMYDFGTKKWIDLPFDFIDNYGLYGNKIVYSSERNGNTDIYMTQF